MPAVSLNGQTTTMIKIYALEKYLADYSAHIPDTDVILMLDAFDTWLQQSPDYTLKLFLDHEARLNLTNAVLFSAEKNCFPKNAYCDLVPESTLPADTYGTESSDDRSRPRFLNSGAYIGRKKNVLSLLRRVIQHVGDRHNIIDQQVVVELYVDQHEPDKIIDLDFGSAFFNSMYQAVNDVVWIPDRHHHRDGIKRAVNKYTGTQPVCLHWNSPKNIINDYWKFIHPALNQTLAPDAAYIDEKGDSVLYIDVCAGEYAPTIDKDKIWSS